MANRSQILVKECSRFCFNNGICEECLAPISLESPARCHRCQCIGIWSGERCQRRRHNLLLETAESPGARTAAIAIPLLAIALIAILSAIIVVQWRRRLLANKRDVEHCMLTEEVDMGIDAI